MKISNILKVAVVAFPLFMASCHTHKNAVKEASTLNIPVFAICDTNTDPSEVAFPIPANDDAIKSVKLILDYFAAAIKEGKAKVAK